VNDHILYQHVTFCGVKAANTSLDQAVKWCVQRGVQRLDTHACFINPNNINIACENTRYKQLLLSAQQVFPDGVGLQIGAKLTNQPISENVNGTDLFPLLWRSCHKSGLKIYLLGAAPGVAKRCAEHMEKEYGQGVIAGYSHGYFDRTQESEVIQKINQSKADLLLVALGTPRQELWIARQTNQLTVPFKMGVGGLLDFYAGRIPRAPLRWRNLGLEWLWRLRQEPSRLWRRYLLGNPLFLCRVLWHHWRTKVVKALTRQSSI